MLIWYDATIYFIFPNRKKMIKWNIIINFKLFTFFPGWYQTVQVFECLTLVAIVAAAVCSFVSIFLLRQERVLNIATIILMITSGKRNLLPFSLNLYINIQDVSSWQVVFFKTESHFKLNLDSIWRRDSNRVFYLLWFLTLCLKFQIKLWLIFIYDFLNTFS